MRVAQFVPVIGNRFHVLELDTGRLIFSGILTQFVPGKAGKAVISKANGKYILIEPGEDNEKIRILPYR